MKRLRNGMEVARRLAAWSSVALLLGCLGCQSLDTAFSERGDAAAVGWDRAPRNEEMFRTAAGMSPTAREIEGNLGFH